VREGVVTTARGNMADLSAIEGTRKNNRRGGIRRDMLGKGGLGGNQVIRCKTKMTQEDVKESKGE